MSAQIFIPSLFKPNIRLQSDFTSFDNSMVGYRQSSLETILPIKSKLGVEFDFAKLKDGSLLNSIKNLDKNLSEAIDLKAHQIFVQGGFGIRNPTGWFHYTSNENEKQHDYWVTHQYTAKLGLAAMFQTHGLRFNFVNAYASYSTIPKINHAYFSLNAMFIHTRIKNSKTIWYFGALAHYDNTQRWGVIPIVGLYKNYLKKWSYGITLPAEAFVQYRHNKEWAISLSTYVHGFIIPYQDRNYLTYDYPYICDENCDKKRYIRNTSVRIALSARINITKNIRITPQVGLAPYWKYSITNTSIKGRELSAFARVTANISFGNALLRPEFIPVLGD